MLLTYIVLSFSCVYSVTFVIFFRPFKMAIFTSTSTFLLENPSMFMIGLPIFISLYAATKFMMKRGKNPFTRDTRRKYTGLEMDQSKKDSILRQGFLQKKVPEDLDVIVVGSGIGGLAAANILSRSGELYKCFT